MKLKILIYKNLKSWNIPFKQFLLEKNSTGEDCLWTWGLWPYNCPLFYINVIQPVHVSHIFEQDNNSFLSFPWFSMAWFHLNDYVTSNHMFLVFGFNISWGMELSKKKTHVVLNSSDSGHSLIHFFKVLSNSIICLLDEYRRNINSC